MIKKQLLASASLKQKIANDQFLVDTINQVAKAIIQTYRGKGKILFCGNGGSAADAQHLAAEFSGKFYIDRPPLAAEACHVNTSFLTAVANDYHFEIAYARYIEAVGQPGDVLVGLSTSGDSKNILLSFEKARELGLKTVAFTGATGGKLKEIADFLINIPSTDTPRIQEAHITIGHIICEIVESNLFEK